MLKRLDNFHPLTYKNDKKPKAEDLVQIIRSRGIACEIIRPPLRRR